MNILVNSAQFPTRQLLRHRGRDIFGLLGLVLLCSGCDLMRDEAERTKGDLSALSRKVGMEGAVEGAAAAYSQNVGPVVNRVGQTVEQYQAVQDMQKMGSEALSSVQTAAKPVLDTGSDLMSRMPTSERELQQMVLSYNSDFTEWLRSQFKNGGLQSKHGTLASLGSGFGLSGLGSSHGTFHPRGVTHGTMAPRGPRHSR